jgi:protein SCO1
MGDPARFSSGACGQSAWTRRQVVTSTTCAAVAAFFVERVQAHSRAGPITPPAPCPRVRLTTAAGQKTDLSRVVMGRITALQLMFTGCSATCPIQGSIFADTQNRLAKSGLLLQLLSISVDVLGDDAQSLRGWLNRHGAVPARWTAAVPLMADLPALTQFLRGRNSDADSHSTQVYLFNRRAELVFVTSELPPGAQLAGLLSELDTKS